MIGAVSPATNFVPPDLASVQQEADAVDTRAVLRLSADAEPPASRVAIALALWQDREIETPDVVAAANRRLSERTPRLHTFVPLYTTNHCDSACKMCAMRKGNDRLVRKFASKSEIEEQLAILYEVDGVRGVGLLTGEYEEAHTRLASAFRIGWAARTAFDMGFERVYINIGSLVPEEIEVFGDWVRREESVTLCVFQETYDRGSYSRFMGVPADAPKGDFDRRVASFDHWLDAGFRHVNPGVLIGLHRDLRAEIFNLVSHVSHLQDRGGSVEFSLPRMRPAMGVKRRPRVDDDEYLRVLAAIAFACPDQRLVLTTREDQAFQDMAINFAGVISPGSPDVAPYRRDAAAANNEESSQFLVADLRRPREILGRIEELGIEVESFEQPSLAATGHACA